MSDTFTATSLIAGAYAVVSALLLHAGTRIGFPRWLEEPDAIRQERWRRAQAGGYRIPGIEEVLVPPLVGILGGALGAYVVWVRWGLLPALGTVLAGGFLLWMAVQVYTVWMVFRRDAVLRWHEERGEPDPSNRWPLR